MAMLMIKCPRTRLDLPTGILVDADTYEKIPETVAYTGCPHCGIEHAWRHKDAWLVEDRLVQPAAKGMPLGNETA
jgi:hypothetical protein